MPEVWTVDVGAGGVSIWLVRAPDELAFRRAPPSTEPTTLLVLPASTECERDAAARLAATLGVWSDSASLEEDAPRLALLAATAILHSGALTARGLRGCADLISNGLELSLDVFRRHVPPALDLDLAADIDFSDTDEEPSPGREEAGAAEGVDTTDVVILRRGVYSPLSARPRGCSLEAAIEGVSTVARAAEGITANVSLGVGVAASRAGAAAAERLGHNFEGTQTRLGAAIRAIGGASVAATREVFDALGQSGSQVCSSTAAVASGAVSHRFGEDAGRVTSSALCAVGSTVGAVHNVASLGRRGLVTNVTKCAATGVAKTVAADDAWEEWPARRPMPMLLSNHSEGDFLLISSAARPPSRHTA
mmetsp:Transcript_11593/g.38665  ORF Transcript_11593/g.38665 Transcript_11593/m.38665 type:complete len:364 (+) Transcript_11593:454-1545(+)